MEEKEAWWLPTLSVRWLCDDQKIILRWLQDDNKMTEWFKKRLSQDYYKIQVRWVYDCYKMFIPWL